MTDYLSVDICFNNLSALSGTNPASEGVQSGDNKETCISGSSEIMFHFNYYNQ